MDQPPTNQPLINHCLKYTFNIKEMKIIILLILTLILIAICQLLIFTPKPSITITGGNIHSKNTVSVPQWIKAFDNSITILKNIVGNQVPDTFLDMWIFEQVGHKKYTWDKTPALERCLIRYNKLDFIDDIVSTAKKHMGFMNRLTNTGTVPSQHLNLLLSKRFANYPKADVNRVIAIYTTFIKYTGGNMQLATPPKNMNMYKTKYNITLEGFASPLNHWFPRFCSAFPSVDKTFGSIGSFFDTPIKENIICNPPFEEEVMDECVKVLETALSKHRLTAIFICPKWDDTQCVIRVNKSKYLISKEEIPKDQANFVLWHGDKIINPCAIYVYILRS